MVMTAFRSLFIFFFLWSSAISAATLQVTVSKNRVVKNEVFQLRVVLDQKAESDDIDFSLLSDDFYLGRPSFGSSLNIINGNRSTRSEWNLSLAASRIGTAVIPAFEIGGARSEPIEITVLADQNPPQVSDLIEIQSTLSKETLYPGESATLRTRLIVKANPRRLQNPQVIAPQAQGLTLSPLGEPNQYQSVIDGLEVTLVDQDYRVTATTPGAQTLHSIGFRGSIVYGSDRDGSTRLIDASTAAKGYAITVLDKPSDYQGTWLPASELTLRQQWQTSQGALSDATNRLELGDSITRTLTLEVTGISAEQLPSLSITYPSSVRQYAEKPQVSEPQPGVVRMELKQVLIPQLTGEITLPEVIVDWWDTTTQTQRQTIVDGLTLSIKPAVTSHASTAPSITAAAPVETAPPNATIERGFWPLLSALLALGWLITLGLWWRTKRALHTLTTEQQNREPTLNSTGSLIEALRQQDYVQANRLAAIWLDEVSMSEELRASIHAELEAMNRSQFSPKISAWSSSTLIALVKKANKRNNSGKPKGSPLAKL